MTGDRRVSLVSPVSTERVDRMVALVLRVLGVGLVLQGLLELQVPPALLEYLETLVP